MAEVDIYENLDLFDLSHEHSKLDSVNKDLNENLKKLENEVSGLNTEIETLKNTQEILKKNISELFNTAKTELDRKDRQITDLRRELDNVVFRRHNKNAKFFMRDKPESNPDLLNGRKHVDSPTFKNVSQPEIKRMDSQTFKNVGKSENNVIDSPTFKNVGKPENKQIDSPTFKNVGKSENKRIDSPTFNNVGKSENKRIDSPTFKNVGKPEHKRTDSPTFKNLGKPEHKRIDSPTFKNVGKPEHKRIDSPTFKNKHRSRDNSPYFRENEINSDYRRNHSDRNSRNKRRSRSRDRKRSPYSKDNYDKKRTESINKRKSRSNDRKLNVKRSKSGDRRPLHRDKNENAEKNKSTSTNSTGKNRSRSKEKNKSSSSGDTKNKESRDRRKSPNDNKYYKDKHDKCSSNQKDSKHIKDKSNQSISNDRLDQLNKKSIDASSSLISHIIDEVTVTGKASQLKDELILKTKQQHSNQEANLTKNEDALLKKADVFACNTILENKPASIEENCNIHLFDAQLNAASKPIEKSRKSDLKCEETKTAVESVKQKEMNKAEEVPNPKPPLRQSPRISNRLKLNEKKSETQILYDLLNLNPQPLTKETQVANEQHSNKLTVDTIISVPKNENNINVAEEIPKLKSSADSIIVPDDSPEPMNIQKISADVTNSNKIFHDDTPDDAVPINNENLAANVTALTISNRSIDQVEKVSLFNKITSNLENLEKSIDKNTSLEEPKINLENTKDLNNEIEKVSSSQNNPASLQNDSKKAIERKTSLKESKVTNKPTTSKQIENIALNLAIAKDSKKSSNQNIKESKSKGKLTTSKNVKDAPDKTANRSKSPQKGTKKLPHSRSKKGIETAPSTKKSSIDIFNSTPPENSDSPQCVNVYEGASIKRSCSPTDRNSPKRTRISESPIKEISKTNSDNPPNIPEDMELEEGEISDENNSNIIVTKSAAVEPYIDKNNKENTIEAVNTTVIPSPTKILIKEYTSASKYRRRRCVVQLIE